jgi:Zn-dependent peptidase ImmA (M78 family)
MPRRTQEGRPAAVSENLEGRAETLLKELGLFSAPVHVDRVAARLGVHVERTEFGDDVSGVLVVEDGRGVIGVNAAHAPTRQRFTIAHEIAHYVLHRDQLPVFIDKGLRQYLAVFRDGSSSTGEHRREREANGFAAALLMPASLVRDEIARLRLDIEDEEAVDALATRFRVSRQAMSFRLVNLAEADEPALRRV